MEIAKISTLLSLFMNKNDIISFINQNLYINMLIFIFYWKMILLKIMFWIIAIEMFWVFPQARYQKPDNLLNATLR